MRADRLAALVAACALAGLAVGCAGDDERAFRIGVMAECEGLFRGLSDSVFAGAELPLVRRGATLRGTTADGGVTSVSVAGRPVELVRGCAEGGEFASIIAEARRLVEHEQVDAVVGGSWPGDGSVLREVARRYPEVVFVPATSGPREVTLRRPVPNLFRVAGDFSQAAAGLGTYAYRELGWRRAAVVADDLPAGWAEAAAFTAEFCALGGSIVDSRTMPLYESRGKDAEAVPTSVDGVAVLTTPFLGSLGFVQRLAARLGDPPRRLVLGPSALGDTAIRTSLADALRGVSGTVRLPPAEKGSTLSARQAEYAQTFPTMPPAGELVLDMDDAIEAILQGVERADGDPGPGNRRLRHALGGLDVRLASGRVRMSEGRQATVETPLVRLGKEGSLDVLGVTRSVDATLGGTLPRSVAPTQASAACPVR
jgi:branched-chain amino acid transport system substrate-binding protein